MIIFPFQFAGFGFKGFVDPPDNIDKYFPNVTLLLHGEGANGSTTFTDSSQTPKTMTVFGNSQISTAQKPFSTSSILFDGSGDYLSTPVSSDFNFGTSNFSIEMFVYLLSTPNGGALFCEEFNSNNVEVAVAFCDGTTLGSTTGSKLFFGNYSSGTWAGVIYSGTVPLNTWTHIEASRSGNTWSIFIDGVSVTSGTISRTLGQQDSIFIGRRWDTSGVSSYIHAHIKELRITKGVARHTANFTAPIIPYAETQGLGARYWRLNTTANNGSSNLAIGDVQLRNKVGGTSVATGGTASASTTNGGYVAANGFDGSAATLWNASTSSGWLKYDFGSGNEKTITEFVVQSRSDGYTSDAPKDFTLEYSSDNTVWFTVATITNQTGWTAGQSRTFTVIY